MLGDRVRETDHENGRRRWFGVGNLHGSCWFIGMEAGGSENPAWPAAWATRYGGAPTIDLHKAAGDAERHWLCEHNVMHATWSPFIRARLAYAGLPTDDGAVLGYQCQKFCRADSNEALLEISAYAPHYANYEAPRDCDRDSRITKMREMLAEYEPEVVVCYGTASRACFEVLCGGPFDHDGFRWSGATLCVLVEHPRPHVGDPLPAKAWVDLGTELRLRVEERRILTA